MSSIRRILLVLLTCALLGLLLISCDFLPEDTILVPSPPSSTEDGGKEGELQFALNKDETSYTVTGGTKIKGVVEIPETHEGLPVTAIGHEAFSGKAMMTEVVIPDSVKTIGSHAFEYCDKLLKVTLGDGVEEIGYAAFQSCYSLTELTLPDSIQFIDKEAFYNCYALIEIKNLSSLELHCGSTENGHIAYYAENIYTDEVGESKLEKTGEYIFYTDEAADTYYLVQYFGDDDSIVSPDDISGKSYSIRPFAFASTDVVSIELSSGVTGIDTYAFAGCFKLETVVIGDGVTHIAESAFPNCGKLKNISIGKNVSVLESRAFYGCDAIETIYFNAIDAVNTYDDDDYDDLNNYIFYRSDNNESGARIAITIGADVKSLPERWFSEDCVSSITFENGSVCRSIGDYAFAGQESLTALTLPDSLTSICNGTFSACSSLKSVTMNGVTHIGRDAFKGCALERISINKVISLGDSSFSYCEALKTVELGDSLKKIDSSAFSGCTSIQSITLPEGLEVIGGNAFSGCTALTSIVIPDTVTELGAGAFSGCTALETVDLGNTVSAIYSNTFAGCTSLESISFSSAVKHIDMSAFNNCESLTDIYFSGDTLSWTEIDNYRMFSCSIHCSDKTIDNR